MDMRVLALIRQNGERHCFDNSEVQFIPHRSFSMGFAHVNISANLEDGEQFRFNSKS